jgi:methionyl-tRNA synthetase
MVFGLDASFSEEALINRLNSELANDLGNLVSRVLAMIEKYLEGRIPDQLGPESPQDRELRHQAEASRAAISRAVDELAFNRALESLWELVNATNKYIDSTKPWELSKKNPHDLTRVLSHAWEAVRVVGLLLSAFLPDTAQAIADQLGIDGNVEEMRIEQAAWGSRPTAGMIRKGPLLFPRMEGGFAAIRAEEDTVPAIPEVSLAELQRLDLRVAEIMRAETVAGSKKLLKLTVRLGDEERTMVAGLQGQYPTEALVGKKVAVIMNLKAAKIKGIESQGMVLAAEDAEGRIVLLTPDREIPPGSKIR